MKIKYKFIKNTKKEEVNLTYPFRKVASIDRDIIEMKFKFIHDICLLKEKNKLLFCGRDEKECYSLYQLDIQNNILITLKDLLV